MSTVKGKYLKDESNNVISPITSTETIYDTSGNPMGGGIVPIGTVLPYVGETAPSNYLVCDGSTVSTNDYPLLCSVVPNSWISGSGISFYLKLPDLRGRVPVGYNKDYPSGVLGLNIMGAKGGEERHKLTINEMPAHNHAINTANGQGNMEWGYQFLYDKNSAGYNGIMQLVGNSDAHNNMQPYIVLNYIIRAK